MKQYKNFNKKDNIIINERIRADKVRVIDENGVQIGILDKKEAIEEAKKRNLDLIQITDKADPPICKIYEYGKFLYQKQKKEKKQKTVGGETKGIRLKYNISSHDLETKAKQAIKFLEKGNKIRVEMLLRGREKRLLETAMEKTNDFVKIIEEKFPVKKEKDFQKGGRGLIAIISKQ